MFKGKNIKNFVSAVEFNIKIHEFYAGDFKGQQIFSKSCRPNLAVEVLLIKKVKYTGP